MHIPHKPTWFLPLSTSSKPLQIQVTIQAGADLLISMTVGSKWRLPQASERFLSIQCPPAGVAAQARIRPE